MLLLHDAGGDTREETVKALPDISIILRVTATSLPPLPKY